MADGNVHGARPLKEWRKMFNDPKSSAYAGLEAIYGDDPMLLKEKAEFVIEALDAFAKNFSQDAKVLLVRAPGRVNLLGMHIDHRGGAVNPIAVRETWFICEPRTDDSFECANYHGDLFPRRQFSIRKELRTQPIDDWDRWTQDLTTKRKAAGTAGDWVNYIKSAALYLEFLRDQKKIDGPPLRGMNFLVAGTLPPGAGLSSSSSMVVGTSDALIRINNLDISDKQLVEYCGQAEWYVGTRGGSGDHAAIKFGGLNQISHLGSNPLTVNHIPFPDHYCVVLLNSLIKAEKSAGARDAFNNRVAANEFGLMLLKKHFPQYATKMNQLRDVNPTTLATDEASIYRMLLILPLRMTREEVVSALPEHHDRVQHIFGSHAEPPEGYRVRGCVIYAIAEILRSEMAVRALRRNDLHTFAEIVNISHDGDRVSMLGSNGKYIPMKKDLGDCYLKGCIADQESGDAERRDRAGLWRLPGGYDVSVPEIDELVDICLATPGAIAARVVGAGLGGSVHCIVKNENAKDVIRNVTEKYYAPRNWKPEAEVYMPFGGSAVFDA